MFGKKKERQPPLNDVEIQVETIPDDFYGGQNPVVKFKRVEREVNLKDQSIATNVEKELLDKTTTAGAKTVFHPANLLSNKKFLIIAGVSLFVLFAAGSAGYYLYQNGKQNNLPKLPPPQVSETQNPPLAEPIAEIATTTETTSTTAQAVEPNILMSNEGAIEFPSLLLSDSADLDSDGLTDIEEELFGSDPGSADTDGDKYNDGIEVYNLYNPAGTAPMKIIDAGLVKEFVNPSFGYSVYYPANWAVGNVDKEYRDELFSAITGENVEIRVIDKDPNETFSDWFGKWAPTEKLADFADYTNRFKEQGLMRNDGLVYFFPRKDNVVAIIFHTTDSNIINYRMAVKMMAQSVRFTDNNAVLPEPVVEPGVPSAENNASTSSVSL